MSDATSKRTFRKAMQTIEDATEVNGKKCIQFIPKTEERDYVKIEFFKE